MVEYSSPFGVTWGQLLEVSMTSPFEDILHPKPDDLLQAEMATGGHMAEAVKSSQFDVRKTMNAMKTVGAALTQVLTDEPSASDFSNLLTEASRVSRLLLLKWGINPEDKKNMWMSNVIEKAIMPYLSTTPLNDKTIDALAVTLLERSCDFPENNAWKNDASVTLSLFKGLNKLSKEQAHYDFSRKNKEKDLEDLRDKITQTATSFLEELTPSVTPHEDRVVFMSMVLDELFELMALSWRRNAQKAKQAMAPLSQAQVKAWKQSNPNGFELKPVLEYFDQNAGRLLRLSSQGRKKTKKAS